MRPSWKPFNPACCALFPTPFLPPGPLTDSQPTRSGGFWILGSVEVVSNIWLAGRDMDLMNAHGFGDLPSWTDIVRDFHCRLAESFFFFYQRDLVIFFVGVCICVCIWLNNLSSSVSGTRLFLVSPLLAQKWLSSPVCNHSPAAISISSSPLVVELTTLVSRLVVKLLMLGVFTLWLPPVFGIYLFCADVWVWTSWRDCWEFCGEKLENSVVVNKPVNAFFRVQHLDLTLRLFSKKPSSCSYKS